MSAEPNVTGARVLNSSNAFKLAVFGFSAQGGSVISTAPGGANTDWDYQVRVAKLAQAAGIEAILPGARWKGYGGTNNFQGRSYETLTWAAALSAVTEVIQVFATVHFTTIHPIRLAKMIATIDHVSKGRLGLNWVAGWNESEMDMFGGIQREHDDRYAYADDYLNLLNRIFLSREEFDYKSEFFNLRGVYSEPKPIRSPRPVYMGAGLSPRGRQFAGEQADINFVSSNAGPEAMRGVIGETKGYAHARHRDVKVFGQSMIYCADTEQEAKDYFDYVVNERGDYEGAANLMKMLFATTKDVTGAQRGEMPEHVRQMILKKMVAGHGASLLIGTPTQVVEQMAALAECGMDGTTLSWVNYETGLVQFQEKILPIMIQAGLRTDEAVPALKAAA